MRHAICGRRVLWPLAFLAAVACAEALEESPAVQVEFDIFSGRPNPRWKLSPEETGELTARLAGLPAGTAPSRPPGLGYRGFEITNSEGVAGLPRRIRVWAGVVSVIGGAETLHYRDEHGLEEWLIDQASQRGFRRPEIAN